MLVFTLMAWLFVRDRRWCRVICGRVEVSAEAGDVGLEALKLICGARRGVKTGLEGGTDGSWMQAMAGYVVKGTAVGLESGDLTRLHATW